MKDRLQAVADRICDSFGLNRAKLNFAEGFNQEDIKIYNFLLAPSHSFKWVLEHSPTARRTLNRLRLLLTIGQQKLAEAKKDILWKEHVTGSSVDFVFKIELEDVKILEAAVKICNGKTPPNLPEEDLAIAKCVAEKMKEFHAQGAVINEFNNLIDKVKNQRGKMPLIEFSEKDFETYVHEVIHWVLYENGLFTRKYEFDEGLCTFVHVRFLGARGRAEYNDNPAYLKYAKFFDETFRGISNNQIGSMLKKNLETYKRTYHA